MRDRYLDFEELQPTGGASHIPDPRLDDGCEGAPPAATFVFLNELSTVGLYLDGDPERTIDAAQPADLLEPGNMEHLDQPLFLLGHSVENPADGIHGDEEYLSIVELPTRNPFDELAKWTIKVSGHSVFPRWDGPTDEAVERASWQFNGPLEHALEELVSEPA